MRFRMLTVVQYDSTLVSAHSPQWWQKRVQTHLLHSLSIAYCVGRGVCPVHHCYIGVLCRNCCPCLLNHNAPGNRHTSFDLGACTYGSLQAIHYIGDVMLSCCHGRYYSFRGVALGLLELSVEGITAPFPVRSLLISHYH